MKSARLLVIAVAAVWLACQPRDVRPGLWLRGEGVETPVSSWSFAEDVEEIFIETRPWYGLPHSTTIWCVVSDDRLFIGSYGDQKKAWEKNVARHPDARLSIEGRLFEVTIKPVTDAALSAALKAAYERKYDMVETFGDDVPAWWYYEVTSRGEALEGGGRR